MTVRISFLGGLGEIGRNCAVLEIGGKLAMIDCGFMFPEEDMLGIDLVLPDFTSVYERSADVECVVLTHGHEDHVGSLAYFLQELNVPVYGTELSVELARSRIEEMGIEPDLRAVALGDWVRHGPFEFQLIGVSHSVPQGAGVAFKTPEGIVLHSGDFKLDPTPIDGKPTDLPAFAAVGQQGVRLLLGDSTNAERAGFVPSESSLAQPLYEIIVESKGRVVAACFASHLHRVQQIANAAIDAGRYVSFLGRSMVRNTELATELGLLDIRADRILPIGELLQRPPEQTAVISTGSQGEPYAAASLMAVGEHRSVKLTKGDTMVISAKPIPGNEKKVSRVINGLLRRGVKVYHGLNANVHVSGHAAQDELRTFINVVRPQAFVPVHGEYRHLVAHAAIAREMNVPEVIVCEDGDAIVLDKGKLRHEPKAVPAGYVYLDGSEVGSWPAGSCGIAATSPTMGPSSSRSASTTPPARSSSVPTSTATVSWTTPPRSSPRAAAAVVAAIEKIEEFPVELDTIRRHVRQAANGVIRRATARRPVLIPVVLEV